MPPHVPIKERFEQHVQRSTGCWLYTGTIRPDGYGVIAEFGRLYRAHKLAWQWAYGPVPEGLCVLHRCDVRNCVRPSHLFLGTRQDNMSDMEAKGRAKRHPENLLHGYPPGNQYRVHGEQHYRAKLTAKDVRWIRSASGRLSQRAIAARVGVAQTTIWRIVNNRGWRHLP